MRAYHNSPAIKALYVDRVKQHTLADELVHGTYWINGKGCGVGCTIHSDDHRAYETFLGIPEFLARLEDSLFEALRGQEAQTFPLRFLEAIPVGADLSLVWPRFVLWLLENPTEGLCRLVDDPKARAAISKVTDLHRCLLDGQTVSPAEWQGAAAWVADFYDECAAATVAYYAARCYTPWGFTRLTGPLGDVVDYAAPEIDYVRQKDKLLDLLATAPPAEVPASDLVTA